MVMSRGVVPRVRIKEKGDLLMGCERGGRRRSWWMKLSSVVVAWRGQVGVFRTRP
jgi:hypothetical protein